MIALLLSLGAGLQAPPGQARLHPPQSVIYVETPDVKSLLAAYGEAPTVQMVRSDDVRNAVGELLQTVEYDLDGLSQSIADQMGVPVEMVQHPAQTLVAYLEQVSGASFSVSLLEGDAGSLDRALSDVVEVTRRIETLSDRLYLFAAEHDELFPTALGDLEGEEAPTDPWGRAFEYSVDAEGTGFTLRSLGADGAPGGKGASSDFDTGTSLEDVFLQEFEAHIGATAVVSFHEEAPAIQASQILLGAASKVGLAPMPGDFDPPDGVDVSWFRIDELPDMPLWVLRSGGQLAIGFGSSRPGAFLARLGGEGPTLADSPAYGQIAPKLGPSPGPPVAQGFVSLSSLMDSVADLAEASGEDPGGLDLIAPYLESSWRMALVGDRFVTESKAAPPGEDNLLMKCFGSEAVPPEIWRFIPSDAIAVYASTFDPSLLYQFVLKAIGSEPGTAHVHAMFADLEAKHGFSFEKDIFGSLGNSAGFYLLPIGGLMSVPGMAIVLELDAPESFQRGLEGILAALGEQGGGDFEIRYKPYRDAPLWYFSFSGDSPIPISPSLAIVEDHLLITLTSVRAKKEIKRLLASAETPDDLHPVLSVENPPPENAVAIGYMDWGSLFEGAYEGGRALLGLMGGGGQLPFDPTMLPEADTFASFYEPTVVWSTVDESGMYTRMESSFGPETWIGLGALGAGAFLGFQAFQSSRVELQTEQVHVEEVSDPGPPPAAATRDALRLLATRLAVHKLDVGRYPARLDGLLEKTANYPNGFLDGGEVPSDGWGRPFRYVPSDDFKSYRLWSVGPDGVDQDGSGDDAVAE